VVLVFFFFFLNSSRDFMHFGVSRNVPNYRKTKNMHIFFFISFPITLGFLTFLFFLSFSFPSVVGLVCCVLLRFVQHGKVFCTNQKVLVLF